MRVDYSFGVPGDAKIHAEVGKVEIRSPQGDVALRLTEDQMLELIRQMVPYAVRARAFRPELERFRKRLEQLL